MQGRRISIAVATVVAALTTSTAFAAGHHQICYQVPNYNNALTFVVQCRSDVPGVSCSISASAAHSGYYLSPFGGGTVRAYQGTNAASFTATISFSDGTQRFCTTSLSGTSTSAGPAYARTSGATVPVLTGYTTDQSGLLMTGIWSSQTTSPLRVQNNTVGVPRDFVLVGGGALGTNYPNGALISKMYPILDAERREWRVQTQDALVADPHNNETFAIGMKIEGVAVSQLRNLVAWNSGSSLEAAHPGASVTPPSGNVVLGGGAYAFATAYPQTGQFLTASSAIPAIYGLCWPGGVCSDA
jgi:hypothetical protein